MRPDELDSIYRRRFNAHIAYRNRVWTVLAARYFSRFIPPDARVLDLGCGYGEFINHIVCGARYAMDLNAQAKQYLDPGVIFFEQDCSGAWPLPDASLDVVFTSNFFEHLPSKQQMGETLAEAWRCLRPGGRLLALGPNIRFIGGAYWDFWDHHLALTEISMGEALAVRGFHLEKVIDRFLPYTMVNRRRASSALISLYLRFPLVWKIFGKQFLIVAAKPE
jgi:SAM-dependent methyltransferase